MERTTSFRERLRAWLYRGLILLEISLLLLGFLSSSQVVAEKTFEKARAYTREIEFDYVDWVVDALAFKSGQAMLGLPRLLTDASQASVVLEYLQLVRQGNELRGQLERIYADPDVPDLQAAVAPLSAQYRAALALQNQYQVAAEAILQSQVSIIAAESGLAPGGQTIPPVLFHATPLPKALIVSPRSIIRQDADISLTPELSLEQAVALEMQVEQGLDVSALVVDVGGVGVYPTMVYETSSLEGLCNVVAHEWIHNYLTLRPLGLRYFSSPALRTMNETSASIAGNEIGRRVLERFYPEQLPPAPAPSAPSNESPQTEPAAPVFDYRAEMHTTRVTADQLLAEGKIEEAEAYLEQRRVFFWQNGYPMRKLNQAYFAFYGAYADQPGGAAGGDPVGDAVRSLRQQSDSLEQFIQRIAWMWSFEQLQKATAAYVPAANPPEQAGR